MPDSSPRSPRDTQGHGTQTASTAAKREAVGASLDGLGNGTTRGGVPSARIAAYKVCWEDGCSDVDLLAAFDDAIADGVDIVSLSLGVGQAIPYDEHSIAIATFHAMRSGVLVSTSAGNEGPDIASATNVAPWLMSVAASWTGRGYTSKVVLNNHHKIL